MKKSKKITLEELRDMVREAVSSALEGHYAAWPHSGGSMSVGYVRDPDEPEDTEE